MQTLKIAYSLRLKGPMLNKDLICKIKNSDFLLKHNGRVVKGQLVDEFWVGSEKAVTTIKNIYVEQGDKKELLLVKSACPFGKPLKAFGAALYKVTTEGLEVSLRDAFEAPASATSLPKIKI